VRFVTPRRILTVVVLAAVAAAPADGQDTARPVGHWRAFAAGFVSSILVHEAGHVAASLSLGARPTFGLNAGRPTVYSGIDVEVEPHKQFIFSSAGLTVQTLLDEIVLDRPRSDPRTPGSAFERGILAGGIGTTLFYLTIGRGGSVSDVAFMARTGALSTGQVTVLYGGIAALHTIRIARSAHYANFFMRPTSDGRILVGMSDQ
jgi:hypothetical protein